MSIPSPGRSDAQQPPRKPEPADKLRQRIAAEAARGVIAGSDSRRALFRADRRVARGWVPADRLPSHDEIRSGVQQRVDPAASFAHLAGDRLDRIAALVGLLATVRRHPDAPAAEDALEHSLQVFAGVHAEQPFDEELLTAALVHDVGRVIDRGDPIAAAIAALEGLITPRTRWLVEALDAARAHAAGTIGHRARQRLEAHPDFRDVQLLAEAERRSRIRGGTPPTLEEAMAILRACEAQDTAPDADGP